MIKTTERRRIRRLTQPPSDPRPQIYQGAMEAASTVDPTDVCREEARSGSQARSEAQPVEAVAATPEGRTGWESTSQGHIARPMAGDVSPSGGRSNEVRRAPCTSPRASNKFHHRTPEGRWTKPERRRGGTQAGLASSTTHQVAATAIATSPEEAVRILEGRQAEAMKRLARRELEHRERRWAVEAGYRDGGSVVFLRARARAMLAGWRASARRERTVGLGQAGGASPQLASECEADIGGGVASDNGTGVHGGQLERSAFAGAAWTEGRAVARLQQAAREVLARRGVERELARCSADLGMPGWLRASQLELERMLQAEAAAREAEAEAEAVAETKAEAKAKAVAEAAEARAAKARAKAAARATRAAAARVAAEAKAAVEAEAKAVAKAVAEAAEVAKAEAEAEAAQAKAEAAVRGAARAAEARVVAFFAEAKAAEEMTAAEAVAVAAKAAARLAEAEGTHQGQRREEPGREVAEVAQEEKRAAREARAALWQRAEAVRALAVAEAETQAALVAASESEVLEAGRRGWWLAERVEEAREWERGVRASLEEAEGQLARSRARVVAGGGWRLEVERNLEAAFARVAER